MGKFWHLRVSDTFVEKAKASVEAKTVESLMFEVIESKLGLSWAKLNTKLAN